jgi:hypothetical protein
MFKSLSRLVLLSLLISAISALTVIASTALAGGKPGPRYVTSDPGGGSCRTTQTSTNAPPFSMSTSILWCWDGINVVSVDVPGGQTNQSSGGVYVDGTTWGQTSAQEWAWCCVGTSQYYIHKIGRWACAWWDSNCPLYKKCTRNYMTLNGNGTYSTNPSSPYNC